MSSEVLSCEVRLVALHVFNDAADVKENGRIECSAATTLEFNRKSVLRYFSRISMSSVTLATSLHSLCSRDSEMEPN
jgi:hypothetical protein